MKRQFYLDLASRGHRMPVGADLVLKEHADAEEIVQDAARLGEVVAQAAHLYDTPLAFPIMDLNLEKVALLESMGIGSQEALTFHFSEPPTAQQKQEFAAALQEPIANPVLRAHVEAVAYVAQQHPDLVPVGMCIGPFSLTTKLMADPISPMFMAGTGATAHDDEDVALLDDLLQVAEAMVQRNLQAQVEAGAKAIFIAEPAANMVFFSPKQLEAGSPIFHHYALEPNQRVAALLREHNVDLIFHCCGELTDDMVRGFAALEPVILSLGSSRRLWEDAALVPEHVVLYGNLPSKKFYSDSEITGAQVAELACDLLRRMHQTGHPFILGSECDVLSVPGSHERIRDKVRLFMTCTCA